mmetsp:Transcript_6756/g.10045  ORF Transcript_6756/g.10045 Transcript_6756/m.10045 type:complete len:759 (-) Transcript_6756:150-2426(-)
MMTVKFISCLVVLFVPFAHGFSSVGFSHTSRNNVLAPSTRWQLQSMALRSTIIDAELSEQRGSSTTAPLQPSPTITTNLKGLNSQKKQPAEKATGRKREMVRRVANKLRDRAAAALRLESKLPAKTSGSLFADAATAKKGKEAAAGSAAAMEGGWRRRGASLALVRTAEIWLFALKFALRQAKLKKLEDPAELSAARTSTAEFLKDGLLCLGPTFIKLGQLLSTRIDILPKEYITVLASLQDDVPGFGGEAAVRIIEEDFGKPLSELFDTFDLTPLAAASLGQVHVATAGGRTFAVKVQRQGLKELFDVDLKNLRVLAQLLDLLDIQGSGTRQWTEVHDQNTVLLFKELDYMLEAQNAERFARNFAAVPWVKAPAIHWECTRSRVLCMEYVPGVKINDYAGLDKAGIDREVVAQRLSQAYLEQLCRHGFFHCDQHPGNLAVRAHTKPGSGKADPGGQLIFYDFGMMDGLGAEVKGGLVDLFFGLYQNEEREVIRGLGRMGCLRPGYDRLGLQNAVRYFTNEFAKTLALPAAPSADVDPEEIKREIRRRRAELGLELLALEKDAPIVFPASFAFVYRSFASLDGVGKGLSNTYDLTKIARPYLKELLDVRDGSAFVSFMKTFGKKVGLRPEDIGAVVQQSRKIKYIEETVQQLEQGELRLRVRDPEASRRLEKVEAAARGAQWGGMAALALLWAMAIGGPAGASLLESVGGLGVVGRRRAGQGLLGLAAYASAQASANLVQIKWMEKTDSEYGLMKNKS